MTSLNVRTLGEVCEFYNGKAHEKAITEEGQYKVVNSKFISSEGKKFKLSDSLMLPLNTGDICLVMSDVPNGKTLAKCFLVDADEVYTLNQRICAIRTDNFDLKFLYYQLNRHPFLLAFNNGENQTNLRKGDILNCPLWVPPIPEQKRIVAILDQAFADINRARELTERNLKNARELFESYLQNVFSQRGEGWVDNKMGDVCLKIQDGAHHSPKKLYPEKGHNQFLYITSKNIRNNYMNLSKIQYVDADFHETIYPRCTPEKGDVLLTKDGANTGNVTQNTLDEPFSLLSSVCLMKTDKAKLNPALLKYYIQSPMGFENMTGQMTGAAIKRIILRTIKASIIPTPPIADQKEIVLKFDKLLNERTNLIEIYNKKLTELDELKKSLLQKAFSGELTAKDAA